MQQGIFNLSAENYHSDPCPTASLSSSIAKILIEQSPQHASMAHPRLNPNYARKEGSRFDLGTAAHGMLLERSDEKIVRINAPDWKTKAAREARDAARAEGKVPVLEHKVVDIVNMCTTAQDFMLTTELGDLLAIGDTEQSLLWQENDLWYRARPDLMSKDRRIVVDYKTTDSAAPDAFAKVLGRLSYDMQAEWYLRGLKAITGREDSVFIFLVQEICQPYCCSLISLSNAYREVGQLKVARAMQIWEKCLTTNSWPGYSNRILYCEPKPWNLIEAEELSKNQEDDE